MCENCGTYKQKEVVNVFVKLDKKERKRREREQAMREKEQGQKSSAAEGPGSLEELSKK